jgi:hypothetical protein
MTSRLFLALVASSLTGCQSIPIDVGTKEPVKVDISMKVDVYQHADPGAASRRPASAYRRRQEPSQPHGGNPDFEELPHRR